MYVGKKIKRLRQHLDLTQEEFSSLLEISRPYYSSIESGKKEISNKMLNIIKDKWGIDESYFEKENSDIEAQLVGVKKPKLVGDISGYLTGGNSEKTDFSESNREHLKNLYARAQFSKSLDNYYTSDPIGIKSKRLDDLKESYLKKVERELEKQDFELYDLLSTINKSEVSLEVASDIYNNYLKNIPDPFDIFRYIDAKNNQEHIPDNIDYKQFKIDFINYLKEIAPFVDAIKEFHKSIENFISKLKALDKDNII